MSGDPAAKRRYYERNREAVIAATAAWQKANPERMVASRRRNASKRAAYDRTRRAIHGDKIRAQGRAYRAAHQEMYRAYGAAYYAANRARIIEDSAKARAIRSAFVDAARAGGCVDCGNKHLGVLQSDHVRGKKTASIAWMVGQRVAFPTLFAELDKCETRCANCHVLVTAQRRKKVA